MARLATIDLGGEYHVALSSDGEFLDLTDAARRLGQGHPEDMLGWAARGRGATGEIAELVELGAPATIKEQEALIVSPFPVLPHNIICVGVNYRDHIDEALRKHPHFSFPDEIVYFTKDARAITGPYAPIVADPAVSDRFDWEVELAVVIGTPARHVTVKNALAHVFGYAVINDVSARDIQLQRLQWFKGKSVERSSPLGPFVVTADEITNPQDLRMQCSVNGHVYQDGRTTMINTVAELISDLSSTLTLGPGDIIATGTLAGVGICQLDEEVYLRPGDILETEIEHLGRQRNLVVATSDLH